MKSDPDGPPPAPRQRIFMIDNQPMSRYGVAQLLRQQTDLEVCGEHGSAQRALKAIQKLKPDLVLVELKLPGKSGLQLIRELSLEQPEVKVLVFSMLDEEVYGERVLRAGGKGFVLKSADGKTLLKAIRKVLAGGVHVSEAMSSRVVDMLTGRRAYAGQALVSVLSEREFEVFGHIGHGLTMREIAQQLRVSAKTTETHRLHIVKKLKLKGTSELTRFAIRWLRAHELA